MTKRITIHFDFEEADYPRYVDRQKDCMTFLCDQYDLGDGKSPQIYYYPHRDWHGDISTLTKITIEWESPDA